MNWSQDPQRPSGLRVIPNDFSDFFIHKIVEIHDNLVVIQSKSETLDMLRVEINHIIFSATLETFTPTNEEEVRRLVVNSSNATCDSDPISTLIAKLSVDCLLTPITDIVNSSL